ncbi:MAG: nucleoside-diphosphate sugar epimerase/dehydratase [Actinomycetia bacterium]|nr:nucleoside-diphosphate sugar epimerase/dehydratase [Actinomycetes bacterium]
MTRVSRRELRVRTIWATADAVIAFGAAMVAAWLRYDMRLEPATTPDVLLFAALLAGTVFLVSLGLILFSRSHHRGTFEETAQLARNVILAASVTAVITFMPIGLFVPRSLPFISPVIALLGMFALRFLVRSTQGAPGRAGESDRLTIVYGAGLGGQQLVRALVREEGHGARLIPVAIIDDDPRKRRWRIEGVKVRGGAEKLSDVAARTGAKVLAVAIPSVSAERLQEIGRIATENDLELLVLPTTADLLGKPTGSDLRQLKLEDLLGRRPISLNTAEISHQITGRRVLVTGAGGSIGSELCRQLRRFGPSKLILLDRDESALHAVQMSMTGRALLDDGTLALADIRDPDSLREIFDRERPEIVYHAAALKHLTLLEQFPLEAWKTNVLGTLNVLDAARRAGVKTFVNISTDKAADPTCVLGYSKRVAERLTADFAKRDQGTYVSVRFGNVLGSRGSVLTAFTQQIEAGGPVTVTHPDVERYFMLIPEACQLVLQAGAIGRDGEAMVLDMGTPVKIYDVARTLIGMAGRRDIDIVITGLRPGEKMSEVLSSPGEDLRPSEHPLVRSVEVPPIDAATVTDHSAPGPDASEWMRAQAKPARPLKALDGGISRWPGRTEPLPQREARTQ